jgi:hypothetical protein
LVFAARIFYALHNVAGLGFIRRRRTLLLLLSLRLTELSQSLIEPETLKINRCGR